MRGRMGRLSLKVVPGSSRDEVVGWLANALKVKRELKKAAAAS